MSWIGWMIVAALSLAGKQPSKRPSHEERGKELYERHCFACHGAGSRGDGPAAVALAEEVPVVRDFEIRPELVDLVLQGRSLMPAFGNTFDRPDARRALEHMQKLPDEATPPREPAEPKTPVGRSRAAEPG